MPEATSSRLKLSDAHSARGASSVPDAQSGRTALSNAPFDSPAAAAQSMDWQSSIEIYG
jgi:hypothetical protein